MDERLPRPGIEPGLEVPETSVMSFSLPGLGNRRTDRKAISRLGRGQGCRNCRAAEGRPFDARYVRVLSADAVPSLIDGLPELSPSDRCAVARTFLNRWAGPQGSDWRTWNYSRSRAYANVNKNKATLERLGNLSTACP